MAKRHPVLTAFGLSVRKQREAYGLTQESLAEKADLDQTQRRRSPQEFRRM